MPDAASCPRLCIDCEYPLHDLSADRCPECGRAFDPNDPKTFEVGDAWHRTRVVHRRTKSWLTWWPVVTAMCVAFAWLTPYLMVFSVLFWIPPIVLLCMRRFRIAALYLLLSPLTYEFLMATHRYAHGNATIATMGLMYGAHLDPATRCRIVSSGCIVDGDEWMTDAPNNAAVRLMTALFGHQPGAYTGPYPSAGEANALLKTGNAITLADLVSDTFQVNGQPVQLPKGAGLALLSTPRRRQMARLYQSQLFGIDVTEDLRKLGPIKGALKGNCLILLVPDEIDKSISLIDLSNGQVFATHPAE